MSKGTKFFLLAIFYLLFSTSAVFAQGLVPQCEGRGCDFCQLLKLGQNVINFLFEIAIPIGVIFIVYGAFMIMFAAGSSERVKRGREILTTAVTGVVIALVSWVVLNTIINVISGGSAAPWNSVECNLQAPPSTPPPGGGSQPPGGPLPAGTVDEDQGRRLLRDAGITVNNPAGNCFNGCTNIAGLKQGVIDGIIQFKNECNCNVIVTGGTEPGHAAGTVSHSSGDKVDIGRSAAVDGYIQNNYASIGTRSDGAQLYRSPNGFVYAKEGTHWDVKGWDVCYNNSGCVAN